MLNARIQIGEAARLTTLSVDTIRFYERQALLPSALRTTGRFRMYTSADITRLSFIKQMKDLGFSLKEVKQLLDLRDRGRHACREVRDLLNAKLDRVRNNIRDLQKLEAELEQDLQKCDQELKHGERRAARVCPVLSASNGRK